ncbi:hypothetical protein LXA43DRAFT_1133302 [Ganoderma leucocontextum]|nr:hypothetical protein LXA43DRAFT_1133302 [Ganoderma leucocontextum]
MGVAMICRLLPAIAVRGTTCLVDRGVSARCGGGRGAVGLRLGMEFEAYAKQCYISQVTDDTAITRVEDADKGRTALGPADEVGTLKVPTTPGTPLRDYFDPWGDTLTLKVPTTPGTPLRDYFDPWGGTLKVPTTPGTPLRDYFDPWGDTSLMHKNVLIRAIQPPFSC